MRDYTSIITGRPTGRDSKENIKNYKGPYLDGRPVGDLEFDLGPTGEPEDTYITHAVFLDTCEELTHEEMDKLTEDYPELAEEAHLEMSISAADFLEH